MSPHDLIAGRDWLRASRHRVRRPLRAVRLPGEGIILSGNRRPHDCGAAQRGESGKSKTARGDPSRLPQPSDDGPPRGAPVFTV